MRLVSNAEKPSVLEMATWDEPETTFCEFWYAKVSASVYDVTPLSCEPSPTKEPENDPDNCAFESDCAK